MYKETSFHRGHLTGQLANHPSALMISPAMVWSITWCDTKFTPCRMIRFTIRFSMRFCYIMFRLENIHYFITANQFSYSHRIDVGNEKEWPGRVIATQPNYIFKDWPQTPQYYGLCLVYIRRQWYIMVLSLQNLHALEILRKYIIPTSNETGDKI